MRIKVSPHVRANWGEVPWTRGMTRSHRDGAQQVDDGVGSGGGNLRVMGLVGLSPLQTTQQTLVLLLSTVPTTGLPLKACNQWNAFGEKLVRCQRGWEVS